MGLFNMSNTVGAEAVQEIPGTPSAQAWFAGGERVGYDPQTRALDGQSSWPGLSHGCPAMTIGRLPCDGAAAA
jgi:hypothetical protein